MYNITFPGIYINEELNILKADDEVKSKVEKLREIVKSGKSTLLVEAENESQSKKLLAVKQTAGEKVTVEAHKTFNQTKGVVKNKALGENTMEELIERLVGQGVANI